MTDVRATYRLQLTSAFGFNAARGLIPYLRDLGISHLYLSPSLQARTGSTHGYDVIDPRRISDALGGQAEFERLAGEARDAGMGIVLDVVPNHMAADDANPYWADPALRPRFFDIDPATGRHRRFFDIDELAGVRQEDPEVFAATHELVLSLVRSGLVDGLRIDHPDGLADPAGYLRALRAGGAARVWVEKILDPGERLRDWPVSGTVGYEFLNDACALFVDPAGQAPLTDLWRRVSGDPRPFGEFAHEAKLEQATRTFAPEVERLQREIGGRFSFGELAEALSSLPVYRTYVDPRARLFTDDDHDALAAIEPDQLRRALLLEHPAPPAFVTRFQQTTPAIMAKGVEDTAFYRYARLLALNDVGGDPGRFGIDAARFHAANLERAARFPYALLTTMTHDAKRSPDVRARIGALSSFADDWAACAQRLFELSEPLRIDGAPDDVERYFIFQTLVGAWPIEPERIEAYVEKALREAKRNTSWIEPNEEWEHSVKRFCRELYEHDQFRRELEAFVERVTPAAERAALGQLVLKLTAPGIPDIYQGDELPYRALVDPDNRQPVDWDLRRGALARLRSGGLPTAETFKLFVTMRLLELRARRPHAFAGDYEPVAASENVCAFLRGGEVLVIVTLPRAGAPAATIEQSAGRWRDVVTCQEHGFAVRARL